MSGAPDTVPFTVALERMNRFHEPVMHAVIAGLGLAPGSRGIDVGCGVGLYTLWLAEAVGPDGQVLGIEPSAERVEAARALVGDRLPPPRLEFQVGDGVEMDAPAGRFDWLWCGNVLHHIPDTQAALKEFARVVKPGGRIVIMESQTLPAMFLPGHPSLERRIQEAESERSREEAGARTFQERRQRTLEALREANLADVAQETHLLQCRAPLTAAARAYIETVVFGRNWGERLRPLLSSEDWARRAALCDPQSAEYVLARPDYYCLYPITVFTARNRA
ncbi:MAG TPA: methyltransferase domain-containing protein [Verrucomicrobiae bacterium]|jgi:demethylmenaquinone methyltransferase / 2-methoxy-6-polyprenyl-1,4-benzoquinol methylase|nr:methyltransferase domain-containing protein [Verrucomicrobiae bacterium]